MSEGAHAVGKGVDDAEDGQDGDEQDGGEEEDEVDFGEETHEVEFGGGFDGEELEVLGVEDVHHAAGGEGERLEGCGEGELVE